MINIVVPIAAKSYFFDEKNYGFPKPFIEICGKTMLELCVCNFSSIESKQFIFIVRENDVNRFGLSDAINVLTNNNAKIIAIKGETSGMACSVMLACEFIDNDTPLLIVNMDQVFELNLNDELKKFESFDAGVLSFESIHPRFAYVKTDKNNLVLEAYEKKPISKNAIAGFFYFKKGSDFMRAAKNMIKKDVNYENKYFVAPTLNQLILENKKILNSTIPKNKYWTFYSHAKIDEYERSKNA